MPWTALATLIRCGSTPSTRKRGRLSSGPGWELTPVLFCIYSHKSTADRQLTSRRFRQRETHEIAISARAYCSRLDAWISENNDSMTLEDNSDGKVEEHLRQAVQSFAARWLPLMSSHADEHEQTALVRALWRRSRRSMLRVINYPSYRSVLSLLLFGLTPVPAGVSEDEEQDGISGQVCVQAALNQVQTLRARQRTLRFNGWKVTPTAAIRSFSPQEQSMASDFMDLENTVYW